MTKDQTMWVRFINPFDWRPRPQVVVSYKPGHEVSVKHDVGEAAIAAGAAIRLKPPRREEKKTVVEEAKKADDGA
jgi:hypothetical protein